VANNKSTQKRVRQNERRRLRNRTVRSKVKTLYKKVETAVKDNEIEEAKSNCILFVSAMDKAVKKGVFHKNTAARKKSKIMKKVHSIITK